MVLGGGKVGGRVNRTGWVVREVGWRLDVAIRPPPLAHTMLYSGHRFEQSIGVAGIYPRVKGEMWPCSVETPV